MIHDEVLNALTAAGAQRVAANELMSKYTSWRIGGPADYFCVAETDTQLRHAVEVANAHSLPWLVLGGGNNVLVSDLGIDGLVILNRLRGISIRTQDEENNGAILDCGAGVFFAKAAQYSAKHGYTGMEWGISIPGTVGGGVVNNSGAHWSDVGRALESADVMDASGKSERLDSGGLAYRYRHSFLKTAVSTQTQLAVIRCRFKISADSPERALGRVEEMRAHRLRTQPVREASAGSTFTNPPGEHAGALIDRCGLKGYRLGDAQISPLHANFILNVGRATASEVIQLIGLAQTMVVSQFGFRLNPEVQFVGRWEESLLRKVLSVEPA
ncbi:MAG: UDP-N-acetylmuramate dehydrogenase [Chloroflexota bacterium]